MDDPAAQRPNPPAPAAPPDPDAGVAPRLDEGDRKKYWRTNLTYLAVLLSIWFAVSYLAGIVFVEPLNNAVQINGVGLGFWMAQQGSIYVFIVLIGAYVILMNRLDRRFGFREE